jgi:hypothetical protein
MMPPQLRKGKRRNYKRPLFEELPSLDMRWLARHNMVPKDWGRRVYPNFNWLNPGLSGLVITARAVEIYFGNGRQQIHWQPIHGIGQGAIGRYSVAHAVAPSASSYTISTTSYIANAVLLAVVQSIEVNCNPPKAAHCCKVSACVAS